jgi:hypothetical protein
VFARILELSVGSFLSGGELVNAVAKTPDVPVNPMRPSAIKSGLEHPFATQGKLSACRICANEQAFFHGVDARARLRAPA